MSKQEIEITLDVHYTSFTENPEVEPKLNELNGEVIGENSVDKIEAAINSKNAIAEAINSKGGGVTEDTVFADYADEINAIKLGTDTANDTVTAETMLDGVTAHNAAGEQITGKIKTVTATLKDNVVTVPAGHIAKGQTLTVAEAETPTVSENIVTVNPGYVANKQTVTIAEAGALSVTDNVVTVPVGYIKSERTATVAIAAEPAVADNKVTVNKGYVPEQKIITIAEAAEPTIAANVVTVYKGYMKSQKTVAIPEMTVQNDGEKVIIPVGYNKTEQQISIKSGGIDTSDATATAAQMLYPATAYVNGVKITGNIPTVTATLSGNVATVPAGYIASKQTLTVPTVTATMNANTVTVPVGYIAEKQTLSVPVVSATLSVNTVTVPVGYIAEKQTLTVAEASAPTTSGNVVTVNKGYQAAQKKITVGTSVSAKTYTPGTADQTIAAGSYLAGKQTIKGDANLVAENIAKGITIFGVSGTHNGGATLPDGVTVTAADVLEGVYYIDSSGVLQQGSMPDHGIVDVILTDSVQTLPEGRYAEITIPATPYTEDVINGLDALPPMVREGYCFIGWGGSIEMGNMPDRGIVNVTLSESSQTLPSGYYDEINIPAAPAAGTDTSQATSFGSDDLVAGEKGINQEGELITGTLTRYDGEFIDLVNGDRFEYDGGMDVTIGIPDGAYKDSMAGLSLSYLTPENVKAGVTIGNNLVTGTFSADATATAADILKGKTAAINGEMVTGTMQEMDGMIAPIEFYECVAYHNPADEGVEDNGDGNQTSATGVPHNWTGYKLTQNGDGTWSKSSEVSNWMVINEDSPGYTPEVGKIYSADRTLEIARAYPDEEKVTSPFYMTTSLQGVVEKITITGGCFLDDVSEPKSLAGEYTIIDGTCFGMDRIWYCPATTVQTIDGVEYSSISGVCIGCADMEIGWDNEIGDMIYEKRWAISYGKTPDTFSPYFMDSESGENQSPIGVIWQAGWGAASGVISLPVLTADTEDVTPYGPTAWTGKQMTWQEREILVTSDARIKEANGVWYREDAGQPITKNSVFCNFNGKSKILVQSTGAYARWEMTIEGYTSSPGSCRYSTAEAYDTNNMPNPFAVAWTYGTSDTLPIPVFTFGNEGWYPVDAETTGLEIKKHSPQIGQIYNEDGTVRIGAMYPAK